MGHKLTRRHFLIESTAIVTVALASSHCVSAPRTGAAMEAYKDASCSCCAKWIEHMRANGFNVEVTEADMDLIRARHNIPKNVRSCHTALVDEYIIEGHVPAVDVETLLAQRPTGIRGLSIPGMPASAPGMDLKPFQPYTVLTFDAAGKTTVFAEHNKA